MVEILITRGCDNWEGCQEQSEMLLGQEDIPN